MMKKLFQYTLNTIVGLIFLFGVLVIFSFLPITGNIKLLTVLSGSMEPNIHIGSMIFIRPASEYAVGDVVTKKTDEEGVTITHRIIQKDLVGGEMVFQTKGDANNIPDSETITQDMIIGKVFWVVPYMGFPVNFAKTTQGVMLIFVIPAVIIVYEEFGKIRKEIVRMAQERKKADAVGQNANINMTDDPDIARTIIYEREYARDSCVRPVPRSTPIRRKIV